jgi:ADP-ribosylglycohydrolase
MGLKMNAKEKAMVLASFAADSLSLGVHWIYNTHVIDTKFGRVEHFLKPEHPTYHPTKDKGEFTHYGDQTLVLLESVAECSGFKLSDFSARWQKLFENYGGYVDGATKGTLANLASGKSASNSGSGSDDLAGAARIAPLVYVYHNDPEALIASAKAQTAFTHNNPQVIESAVFFSKIALEVLAGATPKTAILQAQEEPWLKAPLLGWIEKGLDSVNQESRQAISNFGQMCEAAAAFPGVIHLIVKYENDLKAALVENVMAGGDSAGRGLAVGMVLGAHLGIDAIPQNWLKEMKAYRQIVDWLKKIDKLEPQPFKKATRH